MAIRRPVEKPKIIRMQAPDGPGARVDMSGVFWLEPTRGCGFEQANPWGTSPPTFGITCPNRAYSICVDTLGPGNYPNLASAAPKGDRCTFDGIGIDFTTRLIVYRRGYRISENNYRNGGIILDAIGPFELRNRKWENDGRYNWTNTRNIEDDPVNGAVFANFGFYLNKQLRWSQSDMHNWPRYCGCEILARQEFFIRKNPFMLQDGLEHLALGDLINIPKDYCYDRNSRRTNCYWEPSDLGLTTTFFVTSETLSNDDKLILEDSTDTNKVQEITERMRLSLLNDGTFDVGSITDVFAIFPSEYKYEGDPPKTPNIDMFKAFPYGYAYVNISGSTHVMSLKKKGKELEYRESLPANYVQYGLVM